MKPVKPRHVVVVDQSVYFNTCLHSINSSNYMPRKNFNLAQEYTLNYFRTIAWIKHVFKPDLSYVCRDSKPYWRSEVMDEYYSRPGVVVVSREVERDIYYLDVDYIKYRFTCRDGNWLEYKMKIADLKELPDTYEVDESDIQEMFPSLWEKIDYRIPGYKKQRHLNREWKWDFPKEKLMQTEKATCYHAAGFINGKVLALDTAEADDLAYAVSTLHPNDRITYLTVDEDWRQFIGLKREDVLWRPTVRDFYAKAGVSLYMFQKIFCGDSSDEYRGVGNNRPKKKTLFNRKATIENMLIELGGAGLHKFGMDKTSCDDRYKRNRVMALANHMPKGLLIAAQEIAKATPIQEITILPKHWGYNEDEQEDMRERVLVDRLMVAQLRKTCIQDWDNAK